MPGGDKNGPMGQGPMTGRSLGFCGGYDAPGYTKGYGQVAGRGAGFGRGRMQGRGKGMGPGRGIGPGRFNRPGWMPGAMSKEDETRMLKGRAENLKGSLKNIEDRLNDLGDQQA
ncbi:MAG: DUF5320 domain-containing protein [Bacteroidota bacterium]